MASATAWDLQPRHIAWNISCQIQSSSRAEGVGGMGGGLNMKGKMIWRRRRKVDIWWRRSAVNGMAEGQSAGRINGSGAVIGGRSHEMPRGRRGGFTSQVTFSLGNLLIKKREKTLRSPWGLLGSPDPRLVQDSTGIIQLNNCYRITK